MADEKAGGSRLGCIIGGCLGAIVLFGGGFALLAVIGGLGALGGLTFLGSQLDASFDEVAAGLDAEAEARMAAEKEAIDAAARSAGDTDVAPGGTPAGTPATTTTDPAPAPATDPTTTSSGTASPGTAAGGTDPKATTTPAATTTTTTTTTTTAPKPTTTAPKPTTTTTTTTTTAPKPTTTTTPVTTEPPTGAGPSVKVGVEGDATVALIQGRRKFKIPGDVPAGKFEIEATFPGEDPVRTGSVTVVAGTPMTITCRQSMGICRAK